MFINQCSSYNFFLLYSILSSVDKLSYLKSDIIFMTNVRFAMAAGEFTNTNNGFSTVVIILNIITLGMPFVQSN